MSRRSKPGALAARFAAVVLAGSITFPASENGHITSPRVTENIFTSYHESLNRDALSAVNKLHVTLANGSKRLCSAVLPEPGNIVVTNNHCISHDNPDAEYTLVASGPDNGKLFEKQLPIGAGNPFRPYANLYSPDYEEFQNAAKKYNIQPPNIWVDFEEVNFDKKATRDLVFIRLNEKLSGSIDPMPIASAERLNHFAASYAAGYSPDLAPPGNQGTQLTVSPQSCQMNINKRHQLISSCHVSNGDSGGAHFVIDNGEPRLIGVTRGMIQSSEPIAVSVALPLLGDYCRREIGTDYCTGFPAPPKPNS